MPILQGDGRASLSDTAFAHTTERWACIALRTQRLPILQSGGRASPSGPSVCPYYRAMGVHRSPDPAFAHTTERWACIALRTERLPILQSGGRASLRWSCLSRCVLRHRLFAAPRVRSGGGTAPLRKAHGHKDRESNRFFAAARYRDRIASAVQRIDAGAKPSGNAHGQSEQSLFAAARYHRRIARAVQRRDYQRGAKLSGDAHGQREQSLFTAAWYRRRIARAVQRKGGEATPSGNRRRYLGKGFILYIAKEGFRV